jgi:hypothetical protein
MCVCVCVCMYACVCAHIYVYVYIYTCVCVSLGASWGFLEPLGASWSLTLRGLRFIAPATLLCHLKLQNHSKFEPHLHDSSAGSTTQTPQQHSQSKCAPHLHHSNTLGASWALSLRGLRFIAPAALLCYLKVQSRSKCSVSGSSSSSSSMEQQQRNNLQFRCSHRCSTSNRC